VKFGAVCHHAEQASVAVLVGANGAQFSLAKVTALLAVTDIVGDIRNRLD
jgi:hypothetical protein